MRRTIEGFHQDDLGDWVAELSCLHGQHVRHRPPFQERPWVETDEGRASRIGSPIDCPLCDRAELPEGLELARTAGPFDAGTLPAGLRRDHRIAAHTWGRIRVLSGTVELRLDTDPPTDYRLRSGDEQPIPPEVTHALTLVPAASLDGDNQLELAIDFLRRPGQTESE
jgi:tellurite resistance-related uncharacterized protein